MDLCRIVQKQAEGALGEKVLQKENKETASEESPNYFYSLNALCKPYLPHSPAWSAYCLR